MASIYRKYRPQTFGEMVGQKHIKLTLQNELASGNFVHAYLFCGPRGLGKTTMARLFAKSVNCETHKSGEYEPCNKCVACQEITAGKSMDIIEIDAASHTGVDNVRENIIENVRFAPSKRKYKVFIIDEVHMLSISAFNALLKTLEEPPVHTIFILCTTEIHKVPETIISRCQRFDLKKVPAEEMIKRLERITTAEKVKIETEVFDLIAAKSEGCMRDAESLLGQVLSLGNEKITLDDIKTILPSSEVGLVLQLLFLIVTDKPGEAINYINQLMEDGVDLEVFGKDFIELLRKLILIKSGARKTTWFEFSAKIAKQVEEILEYVAMNKLAQIVKVFLQTLTDMKSSPIIQLPFELAIIQLCQANQQTDTNKFDITKITHKNIDKSNQTDNQPVSIGPDAVLYNKTMLNENNDGVKSIEKTASKKEEGTREDSKKENNSIDFDEIKKHWIKIIIASHARGTNLMFINQNMVWPLKIKGKQLILGFKYDLHKCGFETNGNAELFAKVVKEITTQEVVVLAKTLKPSEVADFEIAEADQTNKNLEISGIQATENNILDQVLETFGGEVV